MKQTETKNRSWQSFFANLRTTALTLATLAISQASFASISNLQASSDATTATYSYSYSSSPKFLRVYLDTDSNSATGYSFNGIGANYLIENGTLYRYTGTGGGNWAWAAVSSSNMVKGTGTVKFAVSRASLGSPSALRLIANTSAGENSAILNQILSSTTTTTTSTTSTTLAPATTTTTVAPVTTTTTVPSGPTGSVNQVGYSVSSAAFSNPERGFYHQTYCSGAALDLNTLKSYRTNGSTTVLRCYWYLKNFKTSLISQANLDLFQQNMNTIRAAGLKTVLRFAYDDSSNVDASPAMVQQHLNQLAPYLQKNADVITTMEAGFIGQWGEWADSTNFGSWNNWTAQNWVDRKAVVDRILQILPPEKMVQIRTPSYKVRMYGSAALTATEAFTSSSKARVGHHNDCFLASATDFGTYTNTSVEYPYLAQETQFLPMGGETCAVNAPRTSCATALSEMAKFHWSQLHDGYNIDVINGWKSEGCFPEINVRLGYRFALQNGSFSTSAKVGGQISVNMNIVNQGFSAPFSPRGLELILRNTSTGAVYHIPMNSDPRRWLPGSTINVAQNLTLPSSLPPGNYALLLNLPDPTSSLYGRPEYSIQLANTGVWEASTGFNNLNSVLTVSQ